MVYIHLFQRLFYASFETDPIYLLYIIIFSDFLKITPYDSEMLSILEQDFL